VSVPYSLKVGPFTSNILVRKRHILFYIAIFWLSILAILIEFWWYWHLMWTNNNPLYFYIFLPLFAFIAYVSLVITSLIISKIFLMVINIIHKPREGVFLRDPSDKDYNYWGIRNTIKKWPIWVSHKFPFPFLDNLCFKVFGVKTKFSNSLFEGWVDTEFIEFGKNIVVGQASLIQSSVIVGNLLIIRKTIIEDNVRIGAHSIVMPGTVIGKNCILAAHSLTTVEQNLKSGWIYLGIPAKKYKLNKFFEDNLESKIEESVNLDEIRLKYEELYKKQERIQVSFIERRKIKEDKIKQEKRRKGRVVS
jgi:acyl-[acyl carrier protein]--UDP-N-acetylglucosamine O-acyltransferase